MLRRFESEERGVRVLRVATKQEDNQGHLTEIFFEFLSEEDGSVELFYEEVDRENYSKVMLLNARSIVYEWSSGGQWKNITVDMEYRLSDGRWHSVNIERNIMEVMVMVDLREMRSRELKQTAIAKHPNFIVSNSQVFYF